jgi:hypothetical protein
MLPLLAVPIVVDLAAGAAVRTELAAIMVEACSRAAGGDGCVLADRDHARTAAKALAVVRFDGPEHHKLTIDVAVIGSPDQALRSRNLTFRDEDPLPERFRTAGLTVASLAAGDSGGAITETTPSVEPRVEPPGPAHGLGGSRPWFAGAGALVGTGIECGPARIGGWMTTAIDDPRSPFFVALSGSYAQTPHDLSVGLSVRWVTVAVGGGLRTVVQPLHAVFRLRLEGFTEWTSAAVHDRAPAATDAGQLLGVGSRAGLDFVWPAGSPVQLAAGAEGFLRTHATVVRVRGEPEATIPLGGYTATVGLHVSLW